MKKLKSIGFAMLYLVIPIALQFLLGFMISCQIIVQRFFGGSGFDVDAVQQKLGNSQFNIILVALLNLILIVSMGLWYFFIRVRKERAEVPYRKILSARSLLCTFGLAVCGQFLCNIIMLAFRVVFPKTYEGYLELVEGLDIHVLPAWAMLFIVAVWSPLAEEIVFRAMIYRTLRKGFAFLPAALISGILFGAYHMNWVQGVYAAVLGILLAFVYEKTNSLLGCYLFHFMFNLSSYAIEALQKVSVIPTALLGLFVLAMHVVSVVGIGFLIWRFAKIYERPKPDVEWETLENKYLQK